MKGIKVSEGIEEMWKYESSLLFCRYPFNPFHAEKCIKCFHCSCYDQIMTSPAKYDVIIIGGFGHVGLPLGIMLAHAGLQVALYDINTALAPSIQAGKMPFIEHGSEPLLKQVIGKTLHISRDISEVANASTILITIGTPVDEYLSPKTKALFALADTLFPYVHEDQCILLRSTVYPGSSKYLHQYFTENGHPIHLTYCPERIVQGYAIQELKQLPQIISGFSKEALATARKLFGALGVETIEVEPEEAELSKLYLNAFRYIQFAVGNQFYTIAKERGLDYDRIYKAMTHHYDRARDLPRPGFAAGPCLLKDTMQLAASCRSQFLLGHSAMMVNEGLPSFLVDQIRQKHDLTGKKVGILGMAFKANIDDIRDSLSYKLRKMLRFHGAHVVCSDDFVSDPTFVPKEDLISSCDIIIVGVPHTAYRELQTPSTAHVVDLWGVLPS
jgi:UDP-N-acetyl-D-mannosaminuronic acid dehydrogenase